MWDILDFNRLGWVFSESLKENHTTKEEALSEKRGKYDHSFFLSLDVLNEKRAVISIHIHTFETFHLIPWFHKMNWKQYQSWNSRWVPFITKNKAWLRNWVWYCPWFKLWGTDVSSKAMLYAPITSLLSNIHAHKFESLVVGNLLNREVRLHVQHLQVTWRIFFSVVQNQNKLSSLINRYDWHPFFCIYCSPVWIDADEKNHNIKTSSRNIEASQTRQQAGVQAVSPTLKKVLWKKSLFGELVFTDGLLFNACFCGQRRYEPFIHSCKQKGRKYCFLLLLLQVGLSSGLSSQSPRLHNRNHLTLD